LAFNNLRLHKYPRTGTYKQHSIKLFDSCVEIEN
jgi:hypothetical protein